MELKLSQTAFLEDHIITAEQGSIQEELIASREMAGLEEKLSEYAGVQYSVSVQSATTGMLMALKAAGVKQGDTVLCTSFSYLAIAEIITLAGARPMFVDINPNTYNIDPYCLEYVIGRCQRGKLPIPKALVAVDLFGAPCNYDALEEICTRRGIVLIEDMCHSFGAVYAGRRAGSFGRMAVGSFFPARPLGELGEGGVVYCHDMDHLRKLRSLRRKMCFWGPDSGLPKSSYLDTVQASIVNEKLASFDNDLLRRQKIAQHYKRRLDGAVKTQLCGEGYHSAYTQFAISLKNTHIREGLMEHLNALHIPSHIFTPSPLGGEDDDTLQKSALVNARAVAQKILTIPMHPYLSTHIIDYVCDNILDFLKRE